MKGLVYASLLAIFIVGCASTETVVESKGQGEKRVYSHTYEAVYKATLEAAAKHKLEVVESNKTTRRIVLTHGTTWLSWGENIAIFFNSISGNKTEVEIVSKPVMAPLNFPPEWGKILHKQIGSELNASK